MNFIDQHPSEQLPGKRLADDVSPATPNMAKFSNYSVTLFRKKKAQRTDDADANMDANMDLDCGSDSAPDYHSSSSNTEGSLSNFQMQPITTENSSLTSTGPFKGGGVMSSMSFTKGGGGMSSVSNSKGISLQGKGAIAMSGSAFIHSFPGKNGGGFAQAGKLGSAKSKQCISGVYTNVPTSSAVNNAVSDSAAALKGGPGSVLNNQKGKNISDQATWNTVSAHGGMGPGPNSMAKNFNVKGAAHNVQSPAFNMNKQAGKPSLHQNQMIGSSSNDAANSQMSQGQWDNDSQQLNGDAAWDQSDSQSQWNGYSSGGNWEQWGQGSGQQWG